MKHLLQISLAMALMLSTADWARAQTTVTLAPSKDNTLYESSSGALSNGAGDYLFAGVTAGNLKRRALLAFDVASEIPSGSTILSVDLTVNVSKEPSGDGARTFSLRKPTSDWGEGTSDAGSPGGQGAPSTANDATWMHSFFDTASWPVPGGDFEGVTATSSIDNPGTYSWVSTPELVADVQGWVDNPSSNFGWGIFGDEATNRNARRFDSREHPVEANRPSLRVQFQPPNVGVDDAPGIPAVASLLSTYPNPFTESTTIEFEVAEARPVTLEVYDTLGRRVTTLSDGFHGAGSHTVTLRADGLPAGVYFVRLASGDVSMYRQAVLMR